MSDLPGTDARADLNSPLATPVIIVGGGPVGLGVALELAHHGVGCLIVEPRREVSWLRPRAKTTSARTMEHFRRWGIATRVRHRAPLSQSWSDIAVFCTTVTGREITRFDRCLGLHLVDDDLVSEGGQQAPQALIESVMREAVATKPNTRLLTGWAVTSLDQDEHGVTASIRSDDGEVRTVRAGFAVGCDGARSLVRGAIGSRLEGSDDSRANLNIVFRSRGLVERNPHGDAVHYWVLNPSQPGVVGRLDLIDTWWCIAVGVDASASVVDPEAMVRNLIGDERSEIDVEVISTDPWRARMQVADRFGSGRVFLAGDSAHQNPPWGGHGYNTGIGDAVNIGWKLAAVVRGWAPLSLLDSYEVERRPVSIDTIAVASKNMSTLAPELADPRLMGPAEDFAAFRPLVEEVVQRAKYGEFHSLGLVLGTSYGSSPIVAGDGTPIDEALAEGDDYRPSAAPGRRLPHHWLSPGESLYDLLGTEYSLVGDLDAPGASRLAAAADRLGIPVTMVRLPNTLAMSWFGAPLVLVRPDQHVAWRGADPDAPGELWRRVTGHIGASERLFADGFNDRSGARAGG